jgi:predicted ABC-type ATPase
MAYTHNVYVVAGPNGSGKTTFAREFLPNYVKCPNFVNHQEDLTMKKRLTMQDKAETAIKVAVRKVIAEHKKSGRPIAIWKNGKAVNVPADSI